MTCPKLIAFDKPGMTDFLEMNSHRNLKVYTTPGFAISTFPDKTDSLHRWMPPS
jgi:hypothetical protein